MSALITAGAHADMSSPGLLETCVSPVLSVIVNASITCCRVSHGIAVVAFGFHPEGRIVASHTPLSWPGTRGTVYNGASRLVAQESRERP